MSKYPMTFTSKKLTVLDEITGDRILYHRASWQACVKCKIGELAHNKVFIRGTLPCDVLLIGEGPGQTEDITGIPFIGRAGKELDVWLKRAFSGFKFTWAITNTVACRPTNFTGGPNRPPTWEEQENCLPRAQHIFNVANPKMVFLVGKVAQDWWMNNWRTIVADQGLDYAQSHKMIHPSALLRMSESDQVDRHDAEVHDMIEALKWLQDHLQDKQSRKEIPTA